MARGKAQSALKTTVSKAPVRRAAEAAGVRPPVKLSLPSSETATLVQFWIGAKARVPVALIAEINALATEVFESEDAALRWLQAPNLATDDRAPVELIGEPNGFKRVRNLLLRIEYGVLA